MKREEREKLLRKPLTRREIFKYIKEVYPELNSFQIDSNSYGRYYSIKREVLMRLFKKLKIESKIKKGRAILKWRLALEVINKL